MESSLEKLMLRETKINIFIITSLNSKINVKTSEKITLIIRGLFKKYHEF